MSEGGGILSDDLSRMIVDSAESQKGLNLYADLRKKYHVAPLRNESASATMAQMFLQQKLMPSTSMDKTQQRIMMAMPIIFTVMMLSLPSGLVLYMLTNTLFSILQQRRICRDDGGYIGYI